MLVSHRKQFIYLKTIKTASTSVECFFEPYCLPEGQWTFKKFREQTEGPAGIIGYRGLKQRRWFGWRRRRWYDHMPAVLVKRQLPPPIWDGYFKFCVIRNPFDKVVSAFHFFQWLESRGLNRLAVPARDNEMERFRDWVARSVATGREAVDRDCYTIKGEICVDYVVRYENLKPDLRTVCQRLKVDDDLDSLKNLVGGVRPISTPIAAYYDDATRSIVEKVFAFELAHFGYQFPG